MRFKFFYLTILFGSITYAQSPVVDPNWQLVAAKSDDFNSTSLDLTKWKYINEVGISSSATYDCCNWGGNSRFTPANVAVSGTELQLKVDAPSAGATPPYDFTKCCNTGGIISVNPNYDHGYFEMKAQLPGSFDLNGIPHGDKFWPSFWTFYQVIQNNCTVSQNEIDILEPSGSQYADGKTNVCGWWGGTNCGGSSLVKYGQGTYTNSTALFNSYHKYAVEWGTNKIIFYFDDIPFYERYDDASLSMAQQYVVIDQQIDIGVNDFHPSTTFPQYMKVDYFHYYTLNKDCANSATLLNNTDISNFVFAVKSDITFGSSSSSLNLNSGDNKIFRAVNSLTILGGMTIPSGCNFSLIPTPCN